MVFTLRVGRRRYDYAFPPAGVIGMPNLIAEVSLSRVVTQLSGVIGQKLTAYVAGSLDTLGLIGGSRRIGLIEELKIAFGLPTRLS